MRTDVPNRDHKRSASHLTDADLNELIDGTMAEREARIARAHLDSCADCADRLHTLQATVSALQEAPSLRPRRSFQLTPQQAHIPVAPPSRTDRLARWLLPGVPALRVATIVVALLLVSVTALDVLVDRNGSPDTTPVVLMQDAEVAEQQAPIDAVATTGDAALEAAPAQSSDTSILSAAESGMQRTSDDGDSATGAGPEEASSSDAESAPAMMAPEPAAAPAGSPAVDGTPVPAEPERAGSSGPQVSGWRIAELGLLLLLIWLIVSWIGRNRFEDRRAEEQPADTR